MGECKVLPEKSCKSHRKYFCGEIGLKSLFKVIEDHRKWRLISLTLSCPIV